MFAIRLLPIMPYGLLNFAAGLTSVSFKDYVLGTSYWYCSRHLALFMLGSSGWKVIKTADV
jgi:uncharacterized membrane protein YdjX (TVP38/TMEM64 family)